MNAVEKIRIGLAGFGTVGCGLARILDRNRDWITRRTGKDLSIKTILVRDRAKKRAYETEAPVQLTINPDDLINDPEINIIVELMGGLDASRRLIETALESGKHVVTANKHLLAEHGPRLFQLAAKNNVALAYEASVAGGIPIVQALKESLAGNRIRKIEGILNGTANYILSQMSAAGLEFATALDQAKELGYAESDPTLDIAGLDAAHKLVILIRLAFGRDYPLGLLPVRGVADVTPLDIGFAQEFGYRIKLIAQVRALDGRLEAGVFPALINRSCLLAQVEGNYNAVRVEGNAVGPVTFHGQGAGGLPTASAVLADIMSLCREGARPDNTGFGSAELKKADILDPDQTESMHYFRFTVADRAGVMAAISKCMFEHGVSIAQAVQKGDALGDEVPIVFLTHEASASAVEKTVAEIDAMEFIVRPTVHYRIL
ncbi:MAG: homoserine dehydrogenase [Desulfovibrionaceae bacterium]|nr:homoserine dehydrogenase [Desulfovibrionaceae bacterium]